MKGDEKKTKALGGYMNIIMGHRDKLISNDGQRTTVEKAQRDVARSMDFFNLEQGLELVIRNEKGIAYSPLRYFILKIYIKQVHIKNFIC